MRISDWSSDVCSSDLTEALIMAIKLNPKDAKAFYHLGMIKKLQGQDAEALDAYSMAVAIKPAYAEAHINLGQIAIDHNNYELDEKACLKALEDTTQIATPYSHLYILHPLPAKTAT